MKEGRKRTKTKENQARKREKKKNGRVIWKEQSNEYGELNIAENMKFSPSLS